ncbi:ABC transporter ATP-binding protein [Streptomyces qinzhouensis]|uniref:ABC transporter ATP-binding protein n=1 Tax=Streptomyces qinzhouensis TaxID=2599401 RepID=A0A5B8JPE1_9ACTN|nr:ABC transporter ATP-binding protein [Streptomyces qinzhouensis]QDY79720.1 ABC transporter ATP-binding protein [Streptomyces qinzhouensis]
MTAPGGDNRVPAEPGEPRDLLPVATPARTRTAVRELVRPHRGLAAAGLAVLIAATVVGLFTQPLIGRIVDIAAGNRAADALTPVVLLLVAVALAQGLATAAGLGLVARLGETVLAHLRERFIERALGLPLERVERAGSGDLTARVTGDVSVVAEAVRRALPEFVRSVLAIVLTMGALALLDWRFLLAALVAVPVQALTARWYLRRAVPLYARQRIAGGTQQQQLLDTVRGAATVRAFRLEREHTAKVTERSRALVGLTMRGVDLVLNFYGRLHFAEFAGLAAVLVTGFLLVRDGSASVGTATAAALYFHSLFTPINAALVLLDEAQSAMSGLARIVGVADQPLPDEHPVPDDQMPPPGHPLPPGQQRTEAKPPPSPRDASVTVTGLRHAYENGHPVLHGVDLTIRPGERVALVGASGAGKTTLAKLIAGIHQPRSGSVTVGGTPLAELPSAALRRTVALVSQETHVFAGPLADDLRLARPDATDHELREALDRVSALTWAESLPDGLATVVGDGGHRIDGARVQALALARLILADPPVVVLDEATAEAGSAGARGLEKAVLRAVEGRTALIVAHRLTQAATADRIVVMDAGRIVESGTHDGLRAARGPYAALWDAWSRTRESDH